MERKQKKEEEKEKVVTIIGARPQFIKASVVSSKMAESSVLSEVIVHTGQHYDDNMSTIFFKDLEIPAPKYNLGVHKTTQGAMVGEMLISLEEVLSHEKPSLVLLYGDTNSTLAGALSATKLGIPIAHIESGLRCGKNTIEETNRKLTDHMADIHFCPNKVAADNLKRENIKHHVHYVGDLMYTVFRKYEEGIDHGSVLDKYNLTLDEFIYVTIHRAENTDNPDRLARIVQYLNKGPEGKKCDIIFPMHPRTHKCLQDYGLRLGSHIRVIQPINYFDSISLTTCADFIITDSGGIQREAFYARTPAIVLREETEWDDFIKAGWAVRWEQDDWRTRVSTEPLDCMKNNTVNNIIKTLEKRYQ